MGEAWISSMPLIFMRGATDMRKDIVAEQSEIRLRRCCLFALALEGVLRGFLRLPERHLTAVAVEHGIQRRCTGVVEGLDC